MLNKLSIQWAGAAMLIASAITFSAFRADNNGQSDTYLHKISSPAGQTILEYNADKTIRKIVQQHKTENADYNNVQLPVYENGRLVKSLMADDENATTGDLYTSYDYAPNGDNMAKISYYRNNAVYAYDSLVYDATGKLTFRYQVSKNAQKNAWENTGYQQFTWNEDGDISRMDTYGKQPGYSRFVHTAMVSYTYDNRPNPQQQHPELAGLMDLNVAHLSAHNIVTENYNSANSSRIITSTYSYAYNTGKFPVRGTYTSGVDAAVVKLEWIKLQ